MASAKALVRVLDRDVEVESAVPRSVRLTPNGYAGVAYAGSVYPLHVGDTIELSGPSLEIADCARFLFAGAEIPYAPDGEGAAPSVGFDFEWNLETNQYGHYVVFNAPERVASNFVGALEAANISIQRWDVSHRPADDGHFYDWFARLRFKGSRADALSLVGTVISPPASAVPTPTRVDPAAARLADAEARVEELLDQLYAASRRAEAAEREVARLREKVEIADVSERSHRMALALAEHRRTDLQNQLVALRDSLGTGPNTAELVKSLADAEELRELALAENAVLLDRALASDAEAGQHRDRVVDLTDQVEMLLDRVGELEALETERLRAATASRPRRGGVAEFLPMAFSRLEFVLDAVEVIANLESPASTMRALAEIDAGQLVGKDLEGMRGWFEVSRVATGIVGSQRLGRIYYKPDGGRVLVSVHIKKDEKQQKRHIDRLRAF